MLEVSGLDKKLSETKYTELKGKRVAEMVENGK